MRLAWDPRRTSGANLDIAARRILDRRQAVRADGAGRDCFGVDAAEPFAPVRPPRSLVLLRALEPIRDRRPTRIVVGPELILAGRRRIDDADNMARSRQHVAHRAAEKLRAVEH